jgi:carboxylesterase
MDYTEATRPFEFGEGGNFVIACHGYTGNPYEMRELGQHLANNGFHVLAPLLIGHAQTINEFSSTRWPDWYSQVDYTIELIKEKFNPKNIFMTGLSMGGAFTLYTAAKYQSDIKAIAPIAAPVFIKNKLLYLLPIIKLLRIKYFPAPSKVLSINEELWEDPILLENMKRYNKYAIPTALSLLNFLKDLKINHLQRINQPILVAQGRKDTYVHPSNCSYIFDHVSSEEKKMLWLDNSEHMATMDFDKKILFDEVTTFFQERI